MIQNHQFTLIIVVYPDSIDSLKALIDSLWKQNYGYIQSFLKEIDPKVDISKSWEQKFVFPAGCELEIKEVQEYRQRLSLYVDDPLISIEQSKDVVKSIYKGTEKAQFTNIFYVSSLVGAVETDFILNYFQTSKYQILIEEEQFNRDLSRVLKYKDRGSKLTYYCPILKVKEALDEINGLKLSIPEKVCKLKDFKKLSEIEVDNFVSYFFTDKTFVIFGKACNEDLLNKIILKVESKYSIQILCYEPTFDLSKITIPREMVKIEKLSGTSVEEVFLQAESAEIHVLDLR